MATAKAKKDDGKTPEGTVEQGPVSSISDADKSAFLDTITPGGTQVNNSTPDVVVDGGNLIDKPEDRKEGSPDAIEGAKVSDSGVFTYTHRDQELFTIERPAGAGNVFSSIAVVYKGNDDPPAGLPPFLSDPDNDILFAFPVAVSSRHLWFTMPTQVPNMAGKDKVRIAIFNSKQDLILRSKPFSFGG